MELTAEDMLQFLLKLNDTQVDLRKIKFAYTVWNDEMGYSSEETVKDGIYLDGVNIHLN